MKALSIELCLQLDRKNLKDKIKANIDDVGAAVTAAASWVYGPAHSVSQQGLQYQSNPLSWSPSYRKTTLFMACLQLHLLSDVWL